MPSSQVLMAEGAANPQLPLSPRQHSQQPSQQHPQQQQQQDGDPVLLYRLVAGAMAPSFGVRSLGVWLTVCEVVAC